MKTEADLLTCVHCYQRITFGGRRAYRRILGGNNLSVDELYKCINDGKHAPTPR